MVGGSGAIKDPLPLHLKGKAKVTFMIGFRLDQRIRIGIRVRVGASKTTQELLCFSIFEQ